MVEKYSKPLIVITAALSIAVITLSVQVVLLTFSVKDSKDIVKQMQARNTSAYAIENRYTELNGSLQQLRRDSESLRNETHALADELHSLKEIIAKINTDNQFMQLELNDVSSRLHNAEQRVKTTAAVAQSVQSELSATVKSNENSQAADYGFDAVAAAMEYSHPSTNIQSSDVKVETETQSPSSSAPLSAVSTDKQANEPVHISDPDSAELP